MLLLLLLTNAFVLLPWAGAGRIIGGQKVKPHSRPYMAHLKIQNGSKTSYCGGFLISPIAVLSAAHCVAKEGRVEVNVTLGAHNIRGQEPSQQKIRAGKWVIHPKYYNVSLENDIVLLKLKKRAKINRNVQFISIPRRNEPVRAGALCRVPGWGWTSVTGKKTNVLMEVKLEVQNATVCQQLFRYYQRQSMLCVGDESGEKGTFLGDSGGPLVCKKKAHGIVSHARERNLSPEVFTSISHFEPWIRKQLRRFALQDIPGSPSSG